jgi:hypothetical protein
MKIYKGTRHDGRCIVRVYEGVGRTRSLLLRADLRNHSPTGFEWGYEGSGPAQLALAILADHYGDKCAELGYQQFKRDVVAKFPLTKWELTEAELREWLSGLADAPSELDRIIAEGGA